MSAGHIHGIPTVKLRKKFANPTLTEKEVFGVMKSFAKCKCPLHLALLPSNVEKPKGCYVWCNKEIADWVNGPTPGPY